MFLARFCLSSLLQKPHEYFRRKYFRWGHRRRARNVELLTQVLSRMQHRIINGCIFFVCILNPRLVIHQMRLHGE
ncbi:hypothetical protein BYT27DRAFT_7230853 [Phlegmacium glaucopus]|nr:hypothetical protein BYT27DRAFT_7230853 [Phlegmacium glaucopus]